MPGCAELIAVVVAVGILLLLCLPPSAPQHVFSGRGPRQDCANRLRQLIFAQHSYHDDNGQFAPAIAGGGQLGKPAHSWRVLIMPYMALNTIYDEYDFDEPWNGPNNSVLQAKLAEHAAGDFHCPEPPSRGRRHSPEKKDFTITEFVAITGPGTVFDGEAPSLDAITDGASRTICMTQLFGSDVNVFEPRDITVDEFVDMFRDYRDAPNKPKNAINGLTVAFANGGIHCLEWNTDKATLRALCTANGGEEGIDWYQNNRVRAP